MRSLTGLSFADRFGAPALVGAFAAGGFRQAGIALAAVGGQKGDQIVHRAVVRRIKDEAAFLSPADQPDPAQVRQMEGQGCRRKAELLADRSGVEPFRPDLHEDAEDGEAGLVTESGEGFGCV